MALDEQHARRLTTVLTLLESAIERMEATLKRLDLRSSDRPELPGLSAGQIHQARHELRLMRRHVREIAERFGVHRQTPEPRQVIAAELSSLWVALENTLPERMKGYGREFAPEDRADWERLIRALLHDTERVRRGVLERRHHPPDPA